MKLNLISNINSYINNAVWGYGGYLLLACGIVMTITLNGFQFTHLGFCFKNTFCTLFSTQTEKSDKNSLSGFQAFCGTLAATVGVGNIAGVSAAIKCAGPGAVFWMIFAAFLGMATSFSENVLGIYFRRKSKNGEWCGGAMYCLKYGTDGKICGNLLGSLFAIFAVLASFGMGNMGQVNKIVVNITHAFEIPSASHTTVFGISAYNIAIGFLLMLAGGAVILGGLGRIARFTEKIVPIMVMSFIVGCSIVIFKNRSQIPAAFISIISNAFKPKSLWGAAGGITLKQVIDTGCRRGMFSNEAGLGSSVIINSNSTVKEPVEQGMWGIFEVFTDTVLICTLTALVILTSGVIDPKNGIISQYVPNDATLVANAFCKVFGPWGEKFVAVVILMFAFTTVVGWSHYGSKAAEYVFGEKIIKPYKILFVIAIFGGAVITSSAAWDISDTFNGLMMIPNLIAIFKMRKLVKKITDNYMLRKTASQKIKPILSAYPDIQKENEILF